MKKIGLIISGIVSVVLGIISFCLDTGGSRGYLTYGGDAYTGIQQAGAQTANNVQSLASICKFGFGSVLLVAGIVLIICALTYKERDIRDYSAPIGNIYNELGKIESLIDKRCISPDLALESDETDNDNTRSDRKTGESQESE
ncbi:MAG: hypothetical protein IKR90_02110 [Clostridia bacterium]|nr:hypothetical protein [Clostridia bacterium]